MNNVYTSLSEENTEKLIRSKDEVSNLNERIIHCPYCNHVIYSVYEDARGHFKIKCVKCRRIMEINLGYFKRSKYKRPNRGEDF